MNKSLLPLFLLALPLLAQNKEAASRPLIGFTVATLPSSSPAYRTLIVTDGLTATDCTVGGGSALAFCAATGSAWISLGGAAPGGSTTQLQYNNAGALGGMTQFTFASNTITSGASGILSMAAGKFLLPTANTAGSGITVTTVSGTSQIAFDSSVLAGVYLALAGSNAILAGTGNTCTPSATTECLRFVGTAEPSAPTAGAVNVNTSGSFEWFSTKWAKLTNACAADCTWTMPTTTATIARTDAGQTFSGAQVFSGTVLVAQQTPASAGAACTANQFVFDTGFVYVCTATNTWKRVAVASW